jgi:parallel beta-helix repeat protein
MTLNRLAVIWALAHAGAAYSATYYVATTGSDANSCAQAQSVSTPRRTLAGGAACLASGDTLLIRGGTYSGAPNSVYLPSGSSWAAPTRVARYGSEKVVLQPSPLRTFNLELSYVVFEGLIYDGSNQPADAVGIAIGQGPHHLRFVEMEIRNWGSNGVIAGGDGMEFIDCRVHSNGMGQQLAGYGPGSNGMYLVTDGAVIEGGEYFNNLCYGVRFFDSDSSQSSDRNVVRDARFWGNGYGVAFNGASACNSGGGGIVLGNVDNAAYNNVIFGNYWGVSFMSRGSGLKLWNNTVTGNSYGVDLSGVPAGSELKNNIVFNNPGVDVYNPNGLAVTMVSNLLSDPQFVDASAGDFHLRGGSPAIDRGTAVSAVQADLDGVPRPQGSGYDVGAYEYRQSGVAPLVSPPTNLIVQ